MFSSIALELHHGHAFPVEFAQQRDSLLGEERIERLGNRGHASSAGNRQLFEPAVLKHGQRLVIAEKHFDPNPLAHAVFLQEIVFSEPRIEQKGVPQILKGGEVPHLECMLALILFAERLGNDGKSQQVAPALKRRQVRQIARLRRQNSAGPGSFYGLALVQYAAHDLGRRAADME